MIIFYWVSRYCISVHSFHCHIKSLLAVTVPRLPYMFLQIIHDCISAWKMKQSKKLWYYVFFCYICQYPFLLDYSSSQTTFQIKLNYITMTPIQPHQEFVIPQNQYVPNSNNTLQPQPSDSLAIRDLCVGSIVFLPGSSSGIERVKCILPHSPCKMPELNHTGYEHFVMILDVFRKHSGEIKCYICSVRFQTNKQNYYTNNTTDNF